MRELDRTCIRALTIGCGRCLPDASPFGEPRDEQRKGDRTMRRLVAALRARDAMLEPDVDRARKSAQGQLAINRSSTADDKLLGRAYLVTVDSRSTVNAGGHRSISSGGARRRHAPAE